MCEGHRCEELNGDDQGTEEEAGLLGEPRFNPETGEQGKTQEGIAKESGWGKGWEVGGLTGQETGTKIGTDAHGEG